MPGGREPGTEKPEEHAHTDDRQRLGAGHRRDRYVALIKTREPSDGGFEQKQPVRHERQGHEPAQQSIPETRPQERPSHERVARADQFGYLDFFAPVLDIENRREEIEVTKLIGASNAFVRRPFLWTGFWYGLLGGLMALALVSYGLFLLEAPVARLAGLYQSNISIASMAGTEALAIIGVGVLLGLFSAWFTAARHMRRIEPR